MFKGHQKHLTELVSSQIETAISKSENKILDNVGKQKMREKIAQLLQVQVWTLRTTLGLSLALTPLSGTGVTTDNFCVLVRAIILVDMSLAAYWLKSATAPFLVFFNISRKTL